MVVHLQPPSHPNLTLASAFNPTSNQLVLFPTTPSTAPLPATTTKSSQPLYFAQYDYAQHERRSLILESYTLFASLQKIAQETQPDSVFHSLHPNGAEPPSPSQVQYFNRICQLYREAIVKQFPLIEADTTKSAAAKAAEVEHHATLHSILSLTGILYLPSDGHGDGVVGEEVLDWVNTVDRAPSAEEGTELAELSRPWEHPNFWPYIYRCILRGHLLSATALLSQIRTHPSPYLQNLVALPINLLESFPRSTKFRDEREFLIKLRAWRTEVAKKVKKAEELFAAAESDEELGGEDNEDERFDWEAGFRCLFELLTGDEKRVLEASEDWREALGAWGVWVNAGGRREDIPDTMALIVKHHPVDSTLPSETVEASLFLGDVSRALQQSALLSTWLVAHLSDLLDKLQVVESDPSYPNTLRNHFLLAYADLLQADPSLWRVVVDYLACSGPDGRARMRGVLRSVNLVDAIAEDEEKVVSKGAAPNGMDVEGEESEKENEAPEGGKRRKTSTVEDVLRTCLEQGLQDEALSICKVYAEQLVQQKRYGEAISFCIRADDSKRIARIADRILEEYVVNGQDAFVHHVDSIPTSLLRPSTHGSTHPFAPHSPSSTHSYDDPSSAPLVTGTEPFSARLSFLARYRDFFALYARGEKRLAAELLALLLSSGVAPKSFWAVMLLDVIPLLDTEELLLSAPETYEILRCLEELTGPIGAADGVDIYGHLEALVKLLGGEVVDQAGTGKALKQLEVVRGKAARHLGRCCCL